MNPLLKNLQIQDRPGNGSAVNEEIMNSPGYLYLSPLDVPDHPIDQIHYDTIGE